VACANGHLAARYTVNYTCQACNAAAISRSRHKEQTTAAGRQKPTHCEVCGTEAPIHFDHDHETGGFRGWLCQNCNLTIGHAQESPDRLRKLADYLEKHQGAAAPVAPVAAPAQADDLRALLGLTRPIVKPPPPPPPGMSWSALFDA